MCANASSIRKETHARKSPSMMTSNYKSEMSHIFEENQKLDWFKMPLYEKLHLFVWKQHYERCSAVCLGEAVYENMLHPATEHQLNILNWPENDKIKTYLYIIHSLSDFIQRHTWFFTIGPKWYSAHANIGHTQPNPKNFGHKTNAKYVRPAENNWFGAKRPLTRTLCIQIYKF